MRKLIQEIVHPVLDPRPVLHPTMHLEDVLAQPAPQLLNGIEPGGIGRQPHRGDAGVAFQSRQHIGMGVNVPVVLDHIESIHLGIGAVQLGVELYHLLSPDDVAIEVVHLSSQGIERSDRPPLLIVARPLRHRRLHVPRWARPPASADSQTRPKTARPPCPGAARRRADSGAAAGPCCGSRDQD